MLHESWEFGVPEKRGPAGVDQMPGSIQSEEPSPGSHSHSLPRCAALGSGVAGRARPPAAVGDSLGLDPPSLDAAHAIENLHLSSTKMQRLHMNTTNSHLQQRGTMRLCLFLHKHKKACVINSHQAFNAYLDAAMWRLG